MTVAALKQRIESVIPAGAASMPIAEVIDLTEARERTVKGWRRGEHGMSLEAYIALAAHVPAMRAVVLDYWGMDPNTERAMRLAGEIARYARAHADEPNSMLGAAPRRSLRSVFGTGVTS